MLSNYLIQRDVDDYNSMSSIRYRTSPNFTELEKAILTEIITANREVIECKRNDAETVKRKSDAWRAIEKIFNAQHGVARRSATQLRKAWQNMKTRMKKIVTPEELANNSALAMKVEPLVDMSLVSMSGDTSDGDTNVENYDEDTENGTMSIDSTRIMRESDVLAFCNPKKRKKTADWPVSPSECDRTALPAVAVTNLIPNNTVMNDRADDIQSPPLTDYNARLLDMQEEEHHTKMELLAFQLESAREEHRSQMEILHKKKALYDLKFQQTMSKMLSSSPSNNVQYFQNMINSQTVNPCHVNRHIEEQLEETQCNKNDDS